MAWILDAHRAGQASQYQGLLQNERRVEKALNEGYARNVQQQLTDVRQQLADLRGKLDAEDGGSLENAHRHSLLSSEERQLKADLGAFQKALKSYRSFRDDQDSWRRWYEENKQHLAGRP